MKCQTLLSRKKKKKNEMIFSKGLLQLKLALLGLTKALIRGLFYYISFSLLKHEV